MKKRISPVLLGQKGHRKLFLLNLLASIFEHGKVIVSAPAAKQLARLVDRLLARIPEQGGLLALRYLEQKIGKASIAHTILEYKKTVVGKRTSGYVSLKKVGFRKGNNQALTMAELIDFVAKPAKKAVIKTEKTEKK